MGVPALDEWFSPIIRRNCKSFIIATLALYATFAACYLVWIAFAQTPRGRSLGLLVFGVPAALCSYMLSGQRLRDLGVSGWYALLWIPINMLEGQLRLAGLTAILIILCAIPGTRGSNKFGEDPVA